MASLLSIPALAAAPRDPTRAAGVFPPWWDPERTFIAADAAGDVVALGRAPFIVVVRADAGDAADRLRKAGALFSIDPGTAAACGGQG